MFDFFRHSLNMPLLSDFPLKSYAVSFSLERMVPGVDNIRHDVLISPTFANATRKIVSRLIARHAGVEKRGADSQQSGWVKEVESYKQLYKEVMRDALNKAKAKHEPQIDYLAQAALIKMLLEEIRSQYDHLIGRLKKTARKSDLALHNDWTEAPKIKDRLQVILQEREVILKRVGQEICGFWTQVEQKEIQIMRESIFGSASPFFADVIGTSLLHVQNIDNDFFILAEYDVALGRRIEDPDKYENLLFFIRHLMNQIDTQHPEGKKVNMDQRLAMAPLSEAESLESSQKEYLQKIDGWICHLGNMDLLFNFQRTKGELQVLLKQKADPGEISRTRELIERQRNMLNFFYRQFRNKGVLDRIVASYEMQPDYLVYCPPLMPQQVMQYLIVPKSRRAIKSRLKRLGKMYGRNFPIGPLNKKIKAMEQIATAKRKVHLGRFLNAFARYHRDISNCAIIKEAMDRVHIATDEKVATLSRENNTLYEFLLSHEQATSKTPIINHAIIKADVRGSTDITYQMNARGLNPASYFSLNFFDPISEILSDYDASKVFIEGDAVILSIFERENTPSDWYGVARACGIAVHMLVIIQRYNEKSRRNALPILELGVGISFLNKAPTFLFDSSNRIMISPAINQADRLSSCSKIGRRLFAGRKGPFNLYVFQSLSDEEVKESADDPYLRFNVNGIELNAAGFEKLSNEIDLKMVPGDFSDAYEQKCTLHGGKFPTKSGRYQRLIIRESQIPVVDPATMRIVRTTSRKYYEVCTHPRLYKMVRQMQK